VPLLVLEALRWLIERGALAMDGGTWEMRDAVMLERPKPESLVSRTERSVAQPGLVQ
jgi:hypothetical protein